MSVVSNGRLLVIGWMKQVMYDERYSVGPSHPEAIEQRGQFGLCIFGNP